jgi:Skp family chaperone for outer membrane proteins
MRLTLPATLAASWALALAASALGASPALAQNAVAKTDEPKPFKLGVVNLKVCFERDKYDRIKDVDEELKAKAGEHTKRQADIAKKMETLEEQIKQLPRGSSLQVEKIRLFKIAETEAKLEKEFGRAQYLEFYNDKKIEVYNKVRDAVDRVGKEGKFDLILRVEAPQLDENDPESPTQRINSRVVLFSNESVDITESVLKVLNADYAKEKAAKGGAK